MKSLAGSDLRIAQILQRVVCVGESSRVMWFLLDRKSHWNDLGYERARARKWSWRAMVSCSKTENCNERCGSAWWPGCPHGTIDEQWRGLQGYGIAKSSVSRQFVEASSNQLRVLCERRLEDLNLVVLMIDGISL